MSDIWRGALIDGLAPLPPFRGGPFKAYPRPTFAVIENYVNMNAQDLGDGVYRLTKTGGVAGTYDASAHSATAASGDFRLKTAFSYTDNQVGFVGMNNDPQASNSWNDIDHSLIWSSGSWYVYESGATVANWVGGVETTLWITREGTTVTYLEGADLETATVRHTSAVTSSGPLFFDSSIQDTVVIIDASLSTN